MCQLSSHVFYTGKAKTGLYDVETAISCNIGIKTSSRDSGLYDAETWLTGATRATPCPFPASSAGEELLGQAPAAGCDLQLSLWSPQEVRQESWPRSHVV